MIVDLFKEKNPNFVSTPKITDATESIIKELKKTYKQFNEATNPYEIESLIYKIKQLELHYSFLINEAKLERNIKSFN